MELFACIIVLLLGGILYEFAQFRKDYRLVNNLNRHDER